MVVGVVAKPDDYCRRLMKWEQTPGKPNKASSEIEVRHIFSCKACNCLIYSQAPKPGDCIVGDCQQNKFQANQVEHLQK